MVVIKGGVLKIFESTVDSRKWSEKSQGTFEGSYWGGTTIPEASEWVVESVLSDKGIRKST